MSALRGLKSFLKSAAGFAGGDSVRAFAKEHPFATFGLVAPTAQFLSSEIVDPIAKGVYDTSPLSRLEELTDDEYARSREAMQMGVAARLEKARMEEMVQRNIAIVAQRSPHLYAQVMAGRILPQGAVVLGGVPRTDLMEELAYSMGTSETPEEFSSLFQ